MEMTSQQATPLATAKGSTPAHDKCKRKVVDNIEVDQNYKFKVDPFMMKAALKIEGMR